MLPDWVSNPGSLIYESGALPIARTVSFESHNGKLKTSSLRVYHVV